MRSLTRVVLFEFELARDHEVIAAALSSARMCDAKVAVQVSLHGDRVGT